MWIVWAVMGQKYLIVLILIALAIYLLAAHKFKPYADVVHGISMIHRDLAAKNQANGFEFEPFSGSNLCSG